MKTQNPSSLEELQTLYPYQLNSPIELEVAKDLRPIGGGSDHD